MKHSSILTLAVCLFCILFASFARAGSAAWSVAPASDQWTKADNWNPATVPNSTADTATFNVSSLTTITVRSNIEVGSIVFNPGASSFTIMTQAVSPGSVLSISGVGVINNSGIVQNFLSPNDPVGPGTAEIQFLNNANAGSQTIYTAEGALGAGGGVFFHQSSNAGAATFINEASSTNGQGGFTEFLETSTAGNGTFIAQGNQFATASVAQVIFLGNSTAADGTFACEAASISGGIGGHLKFDDVGSTAGNAIITLEGATVSGAGSGVAQFFRTSTAGNATIIATAAAAGANPTSIELADDSRGGAARISLADNTQLVISGHRRPGVSIGSVAGSGNIILGTTTTAGRNLTIGANNLDATFTGTITDGGSGGSLTKLGRQRLVLGGASSYTGTTLVNGGTLLLTNTSGSATGTGPVQVNSGTLGGTGIIAGPVTLGPATGHGASLAPGGGQTDIGTLAVQSALTFNAATTYNCGVNNNAVIADQVVANGVTINSGATFALVPAGNNTLPTGTVFTIIANSSATAISGVFSNLPDGGIVSVGVNNFQANYEGGDGNDLTLTVVP